MSEIKKCFEIKIFEQTWLEKIPKIIGTAALVRFGKGKKPMKRGKAICGPRKHRENLEKGQMLVSGNNSVTLLGGKAGAPRNSGF